MQQFLKFITWRLFVCGSSAVDRGRAGFNRPDHDQQHCYHRAPAV